MQNMLNDMLFLCTHANINITQHTVTSKQTKILAQFGGSLPTLKDKFRHIFSFWYKSNFLFVSVTKEGFEENFPFCPISITLTYITVLYFYHIAVCVRY